MLLAENLNFKLKIVFWNIFFFEIWRSEKISSHFLKKATFTPSQKLHNPPDPSEYCEWKPHFFVLTESKMFYSEACNNDERENDEESEDEGGSVSNLPTVS